MGITVNQNKMTFRPAVKEASKPKDEVSMSEARKDTRHVMRDIIEADIPKEKEEKKVVTFETDDLKEKWLRRIGKEEERALREEVETSRSKVSFYQNQSIELAEKNRKYKEKEKKMVQKMLPFWEMLYHYDEGAAFDVAHQYRVHPTDPEYRQNIDQVDQLLYALLDLLFLTQQFHPETELYQDYLRTKQQVAAYEATLAHLKKEREKEENAKKEDRKEMAKLLRKIETLEKEKEVLEIERRAALAPEWSSEVPDPTEEMMEEAIEEPAVEMEEEVILPTEIEDPPYRLYLKAKGYKILPATNARHDCLLEKDGDVLILCYLEGEIEGEHVLDDIMQGVEEDTGVAFLFQHERDCQKANSMFTTWNIIRMKRKYHRFSFTTMAELQQKGLNSID